MPPRRVSFQLGQIIVSPQVVTALDKTGENLDSYIERFRHADFGAIDDENKMINNEALREGGGGGSLYGVYQLKDRTQFAIETSAVNDNGLREETIIYLIGD